MRCCISIPLCLCSIIVLSVVIFVKCDVQLMNTTTSSLPKMRCIKNEKDMEKVLVNNHQNLAKAVFPPAKMSSVYIKVFIQFINISSNGSIVLVGEPLSYTWSKSCLFVAVKYISLYVMNVYSLGAVHPKRRESELTLAVPPFCSRDVGRNDLILSSLAALEDLAIVPGNKDPRLNTVECVMEGQDNFQGASLGHTFILDIVCWIILSCSILLGWVIFHTTKLWLNDGYKNGDYHMPSTVQDSKDKDKLQAYSLCTTFLILVVVEWLLAVASFFLAFFLKRDVIDYIYPLTYLVISSIIPLGFCFRFIQAKRKGCVFNTTLLLFECCSFQMTIFDALILLSFFMTIHHLIWVLIGVVTDPAWGLPVLVVAFSLFYCLYTLVYYNKRDLPKNRRWGIFFSIILVVALGFLFFVFGVVSQILLNRDPIASFIGGILVLIYSVWFNHFKKRE